MNKVIKTFFALGMLAVGAFFYFFYPGIRPVTVPGRVEMNEQGEVVKGGVRRKEEGGSHIDFDLPLSWPEEFQPSIYAGGLGKVRDIMEASDGVIVTSMSFGKVIYLPDKDNDSKANEQIALLTDRYNPHGMAEYCEGNDCSFYLAETNAVYRFDYDRVNVKLENEEKIIDLPDDGGHYTRHVLVYEGATGPELLTTVGSKCNVCVEDDWRRAKILVSNLDGSNLREFAKGLRNSVFMTTHPESGEVYATDMGRDWLGDELPSEEINLIREGKDYGWPFCHGDGIHDSEFDKNTYIRNPCEDAINPIYTMPAHSAPLGLSFIPREGFGEDYQLDLLVVQHGSWNRSTPVGYQVIRVNFDLDGNIIGEEEFLSGFLEEGEAWGRPADVLATTEGKVYVSDDKAESVYLLNWKD